MSPARLVRFGARRLLQAIPLVAGIVTLTFVLIHLAPGDPVYMMAGDGGDEAYYAEMRARYGLDQPLPVRYVRYWRAVLAGDFGFSYEYQRPVFDVILDRLPATLLLAGAALALAVGLGMVIGLVGALRPRTSPDVALRVTTSTLSAAPVFWTGQLLLLAFAVAIPLFPVGGFASLRGGQGGVLDVLWHLALPATCLSLGFLAVLARVTRASLLAERRREYVRSALARGGSERQVLVRHALPNALLPVVTLVGYHIGGVLTGAGLTEVVFGWPGLGRLLLDASSERDYPLVIALLLTVSFLVVAANLVTDLLYTRLDPRIEA